MTPTVRLVLLSLLGAVVGLAASADGEGVLPFLGLVVGALVALQIRNAERIRALERRIETGAPTAPRRADRLGAAVPEVGTGDGGRPLHEVPSSPEGVEVRPSPSRPPTRAPRRTLSRDDLPPWAARAWAFVTGGNPVARVGLLVLFVGLGLLIRYAAEQGFFPIEVRLAFAGAVGAVLLAVGWRLRKTAEAFGLTLQGGGVAVLYLTIYAAYALYTLIPSLAAIALMALVAAGCAALALVQSAPGLAVLGVAGGFAAPVLAGTEAGNHVLLLSYYALLNLGVLGIAWTRGWRSVAVVGFVSTFVTGGLWGGLAYRPDLYASVQPFVALNFAVYFALAVRFALRTARETTPERALAVDGALVFGLPAATFALQAGLVEGVVPYGRAWSAAVLAVVYLGAFGWLRQRAGVRLLADAFLAVGLAFATLALPLAFQRVVVGAMWVLEGAGLVWVGVRQGKRWMRLAGLALQAVAASVLFAEGVLAPDRAFSTETLTGWIVALALALSAYVLRGGVPLPEAALPEAGADTAPEAPPRLGRLQAQAGRAEAGASRVFLGFALFWWVTTASTHVLDLVPSPYEVAGLLGAAAASGALFLGLGRALRWRGLAASALGVAAAGWALWGVVLLSDGAPFADLRGIGWLAAAAVLGTALVAEPSRSHALRHVALVGGVWLAAGVVAHAVAEAAGPLGGGWALGAMGAVLAVGIALALRLPASATTDGERRGAAIGLAAAGAAWLGTAMVSDGGSAPLPYVPILNPLDLASVAVLLALAAAAHAVARTEAERGLGWALVSAFGFGALTAAVLRAGHHLGAVAWDGDALFASSTVQAALAVVWTLLALVLAVVAVRRQSRPLWFFGAAVLGLVVAKLFLVDLSQARALVRIAAFLTVGTLGLLIGYRAPLPPRRGGDAEPDAPNGPEAAPAEAVPEA